MNKDCCELKFNSEMIRIRNMVRYLMDFVDNHAPGCEARDDLRLVFSELLCNAVIHGNKLDNKKFVHVHVSARNGRLSASIKDECPGFDYNKIIEYAKTSEALYDGHGRGILLASALTENLSFNETGNLIRFEMRLNSG